MTSVLWSALFTVLTTTVAFAQDIAHRYPTASSLRMVAVHKGGTLGSLRIGVVPAEQSYSGQVWGDTAHVFDELAPKLTGAGPHIWNHTTPVWSLKCSPSTLLQAECSGVRTRFTKLCRCDPNSSANAYDSDTLGKGRSSRNRQS